MDPAVHGTVSTAPIALLFWFARLASAAIAVVVLVATRRDRLWTAERWFSRGLAVLLVMAVGGGVFVVLAHASPTMARRDGSRTAAATVLIALAFGPLYVRAERVVDRLLYGTRPAPYRVLADITALTRSTSTVDGDVRDRAGPGPSRRGCRSRPGRECLPAHRAAAGPA